MEQKPESNTKIQWFLVIVLVCIVVAVFFLSVYSNDATDKQTGSNKDSSGGKVKEDNVINDSVGKPKGPSPGGVAVASGVALARNLAKNGVSFLTRGFFS